MVECVRIHEFDSDLPLAFANQSFRRRRLDHRRQWVQGFTLPNAVSVSDEFFERCLRLPSSRGGRQRQTTLSRNADQSSSIAIMPTVSIPIVATYSRMLSRLMSVTLADVPFA